MISENRVRIARHSEVIQLPGPKIADVGTGT